jgi:hypothetical protein
MNWIFTIKSKRILTRNLYAIVMSTLFFMPFFYVVYTAVDNTKVHTMLTPFPKTTFLELADKINVRYQGDISAMCESEDEKQKCIDVLNKELVPLVSDADFMAAVHELPSYEEQTMIMSNRWWWPAPLLRQSEDVQTLLQLSKRKVFLLGIQPSNETIEEELANFDRIMAYVALMLIVINTGISLLLMYLHDKRGINAPMYIAVRTTALAVNATLILNLVLLAALFADASSV